MSALLLLDPAPLPDGLGIPAEDWQQTPTSVRHHFGSLVISGVRNYLIFYANKAYPDRSRWMR